MANSEESTLWYEVDAHNRIIALSPSWDIQVIAQQTDELLSSRLIGESLRRFIIGDTTRMFVETMLEVVRLKQHVIEKPYRCDTPELKRMMVMRVMPMADSSVRVEHYLQESTPWQHKTHFKTQRQAHQRHVRSREGVIKRCSVCNNLRDGKVWVTQEVFLENYPQWVDQTIPVFYGVCSRCQERLKE